MGGRESHRTSGTGKTTRKPYRKENPTKDYKNEIYHFSIPLAQKRGEGEVRGVLGSTQDYVDDPGLRDSTNTKLFLRYSRTHTPDSLLRRPDLS